MTKILTLVQRQIVVDNYKMHKNNKTLVFKKYTLDMFLKQWEKDPVEGFPLRTTFYTFYNKYFDSKSVFALPVLNLCNLKILQQELAYDGSIFDFVRFLYQYVVIVIHLHLNDESIGKTILNTQNRRPTRQVIHNIIKADEEIREVIHCNMENTRLIHPLLFVRVKIQLQTCILEFHFKYNTDKTRVTITTSGGPDKEFDGDYLVQVKCPCLCYFTSVEGKRQVEFSTITRDTCFGSITCKTVTEEPMWQFDDEGPIIEAQLQALNL
jgi:hypothetical protein